LFLYASLSSVNARALAAKFDLVLEPLLFLQAFVSSVNARAVTATFELALDLLMEWENLQRAVSNLFKDREIEVSAASYWRFKNGLGMNPKK
jgi:hypothetical protein